MNISFKKHEVSLILEALSMLHADHCDHAENEEMSEEIKDVENKIYDALNKKQREDNLKQARKEILGKKSPTKRQNDTDSSQIDTE